MRACRICSFQRQSYGFTLPSESRLRVRINKILPKLCEDGTYQKLYSKWFGNQRSVTKILEGRKSAPNHFTQKVMIQPLITRV
jgi:hypothetical protein